MSLIRPLPNIKTKIQILEELAKSWNEAGLIYSVTNGLQGYPETIGRDLDICFPASDLKSALQMTVRFLEERGFRVLPHRFAWVYWVIGIRENKDGSIDSIQVDLFDHLQWAFCWVIDGVQGEGERYFVGPFQTDHWSPIGKRLVLNALSKNFKTFEKRPSYLKVSEPEKKVLSSQFQRLAGGCFVDFQDAVIDENLASVKETLPNFRKAVMIKSLMNPKKLVKRLSSAWSKQWAMNINPVPVAPIISVNGSNRAKLCELTQDLDLFLQEYFVFSFDPIRDPCKKLAAKGKFRAWWHMIKEYFRIDRKRSALLVVQIYLNHPGGNSSYEVSRKFLFGGQLLPRPKFSINLDKENFLDQSSFQEFFLTRFLDWFNHNDEFLKR